MNSTKASVPLPDGSGNYKYQWWQFFLCTLFGILLAIVIGRLTEYFTSTEKKPVTEIAYNSKTGPATMIISGFSYGLANANHAILAGASRHALVIGVEKLSDWTDWTGLSLMRGRHIERRPALAAFAAVARSLEHPRRTVRSRRTAKRGNPRTT